MLQYPLTNTEILRLTKEAFTKGELALLLSGKGNYVCPLDKYTPAHLPTDNGRIIANGIYAFFLESHNEQIISEYKKAILELSQGNPIDVWMAFDILWVQLYNERRSKDNASPFTVVDNNLVDKVKSAVNKHKEKLKYCKEWQGWNQKEGLWSEIEIQSKKALDWFGVALI